MISSLEIPEQLATPFEFRAVRPTPFGDGLPRPNDPDDANPPSHLMRARQLVGRHPDAAIAWARLAQSAQATADVEEAIDAATKALAMGVSQVSRPAIHAASTVLASYGDTDTIVQTLRSPGADSIPVELRLWMALEANDDDCVDRALSDASSTAVMIARGWMALRKRRYQDAIRELRSAQAAGADGPGLLMNLGYAHAALGNVFKAIKVTRRAAALAPDDRAISLNLVGYYRAVGAHQAGIDQINRLAGDQPDIELALVLADVLHDTGAAGKAHDVLQRVRTSREWAKADRTRRSELEANLAFLRWSTGRHDRLATLEIVRRALAECDHDSLAIGHLLMNLIREASEAPILAKELQTLASKHREEALLGLRFHHAVITRDADSAAAYACAWAREDIFNSTAASLAIHLLTDVKDQAAEAAELGLTAIRRAPADAQLLNNTAYALCLAGRPAEAKRLILASAPTAKAEHVALRATRAFADLLLGNLEQGLAGYRQAQQLARDQGKPHLEALVMLYMAMAVHRVPACHDKPELPEIPDEWRASPSFWVGSHRLRRELGTACAIT